MMKKFLSFFIAAFMLVALPMAVDAKKDGSAKIEFAKSSHDFGVIKEDGGKAPMNANELLIAIAGTA